MTMLGPKSRKTTVATLEAIAADEQRLTTKPQGQWRLAARRFRERKSGMIGLGIVVFLLLMAVAAPLIAPYPPNQVLIGKEDNIGPRDITYGDGDCRYTVEAHDFGWWITIILGYSPDVFYPNQFRTKIRSCHRRCILKAISH